MAALDGIRVLDLSRLLPGPAATAWLAGQGATVDKVEPPGMGDPARALPPHVDGVGAYFLAVSRGKRSLALDLRHPDAAACLLALVPTYDVLVEGFKPGVMEAMSLGPDVLLAAHPGLIVARISGYGQTGPWAHRPGHDLNYVGLSGSLAGTAVTSTGPAVPANQVADLAGATVAAAGICAALVERARTGRGQVLDIALAEAALWVSAPLVTGSSVPDARFGPGEHPLAGGLPWYGTYRCSDGGYVAVGALESKFQALLFEASGGRMDADGLAAMFATAPRDAWVAQLSEACVSPALGAHEVAEHPHHVARGAVQSVDGAAYVRPPLGVLPLAPAPQVGEHTDVVLDEAGIDVETHARWLASGVLGPVR